MIEIDYKKVTIETENDVYIHAIGDLHIGHTNCNMKYIQESFANIPLKSENHRIILMGDLMDTGIKSAIGTSAYEQNLAPMEQVETLIELLEPYKEQIDGYVMGNHEYRIYKETGIDVCKVICNQLGIDYNLYAGTITYSMNHRAYNINYFHGRAGGGVENALKKCKEMANKIECDIYLMGHCHHLAYTQRIIRRVDSRNGKVKEAKQYFILTGHALTYNNSYAEQANLEISPIGFPIIKLQNNNEKNILVYSNNPSSNDEF